MNSAEAKNQNCPACAEAMVWTGFDRQRYLWCRTCKKELAEFPQVDFGIQQVMSGRFKSGRQLCQCTKGLICKDHHPGITVSFLPPASNIISCGNGRQSSHWVEGHDEICMCGYYYSDGAPRQQNNPYRSTQPGGVAIAPPGGIAPPTPSRFAALPLGARLAVDPRTLVIATAHPSPCYSTGGLMNTTDVHCVDVMSPVPAGLLYLTCTCGTVTG